MPYGVYCSYCVYQPLPVPSTLHPCAYCMTYFNNCYVNELVSRRLDIKLFMCYGQVIWRRLYWWSTSSGLRRRPNDIQKKYMIRPLPILTKPYHNLCSACETTWSIRFGRKLIMIPLPCVTKLYQVLPTSYDKTIMFQMSDCLESTGRLLCFRSYNPYKPTYTERSVRGLIRYRTVVI